MTDLTERSLEDIILEVNTYAEKTGTRINIHPASLYIRQSVIDELAAERDITPNEMLIRIKDLVSALRGETSGDA